MNGRVREKPVEEESRARGRLLCGVRRPGRGEGLSRVKVSRLLPCWLTGPASELFPREEPTSSAGGM